MGILGLENSKIINLKFKIGNHENKDFQLDNTVNSKW